MEQGSVLPSCVTNCELQELQHPLHLCDCREGTTLWEGAEAIRLPYLTHKVGMQRMAH